ncbi:hypothetical protein Hanom_Chr16g01454801 [Helianthus anomalus]
MSDFNSILWRINLRSGRKKQIVKRINNDQVMAFFVKLSLAGKYADLNQTFCRNRVLASRDEEPQTRSRHATMVMARDEY